MAFELTPIQVLAGVGVLLSLLLMWRAGARRARAAADTDLRDKLTDAVTAAFTEAANRATGDMAVPFMNSTVDRSVHERSQRPVHRSGRRLSFAEYLTMARRAWSPGVEITPAWVRRATGCSRGLSSRLAAALTAEIRDGEVLTGP